MFDKVDYSPAKAKRAVINSAKIEGYSLTKHKEGAGNKPDCIHLKDSIRALADHLLPDYIQDYKITS